MTETLINEDVQEETVAETVGDRGEGTVEGEIQEMEGEKVEDEEVEDEEVEGEEENKEESSLTPEKMSEIYDDFEKEMVDSPVISQDIGTMEEEKASSIPTIKKAAYYVVFGPDEHDSTEVGEAIKSVHIARFETKAQLKDVIKSLADNGLKLIDILKGRPLQYEVTIKKVSEIKLGN